MEKTRYVYTKDKLIELTLDVIRLYDEYQDKHGQPRNLATLSTVREVLESLNAPSYNSNNKVAE